MKYNLYEGYGLRFFQCSLEVIVDYFIANRVPEYCRKTLLETGSVVFCTYGHVRELRLETVTEAEVKHVVDLTCTSLCDTILS